MYLRRVKQTCEELKVGDGENNDINIMLIHQNLKYK